MKILIVNRNYFVTGGPENYMFSLMENMPQHQYVPFCVDFEQNRETPYRKYFVSPPAGAGTVYFKEYKMSSSQKLKYAFNSIYHFEARQKLEKLITDERPDIALFLNSVYFSDSIIDACRSHNVPIVWRMSDFHKVCANYLLYRDGKVCEDCLEDGFTSAFRNRCGGYQRSFGAAAIKVAGMWLSRLRRRYECVDYFITPSGFTREKMIQGGFCPEKIIHIPTWVGLPEQEPEFPDQSRDILYVGRLSYEKGIETLLEAFGYVKNKQVRLTIVGDDSTVYAQQLKESILPELTGRINFTGFQNKVQIEAHYKAATCVVVPSVCYENQPNVVLEGMAQSRPVVVSDHGSLREMVLDNETGYRFIPGNASDLAAKLDLLLQDNDKAKKMGMTAREFVRKYHSIKSHLSSLSSLFEASLKGSV